MDALEYFPEEICETKHCIGIGCYYVNGEYLCDDCLSATDMIKDLNVTNLKKELDKTKTNIRRYEK